MSEPPPPPPPSQPQPLRIPPCPDCGGTRIGDIGLTAADARYTHLHPFSKLRLGILGGALGRVVAYVCLDCGNVKLYAWNLEWVRRAAQQSPNQFRW